MSVETDVTELELVDQRVGRRTTQGPFRGRSNGSSRTRVRNVVLPAAAFALLLGVWTYFSDHVLDPRRRFLLPSPHDVVTQGLLNPANRGELFAGLLDTAKTATIGLGLAIAVGTVLAVILCQEAWLERAFFPWVLVLQTIPVLAIVPLISFWFGYGQAARVLVCVLIALFPIVTTTLFGLKSAASVDDA
ncbi:ABC transporter permease [Xylanimonas ulmi]|uniref:ABC transmembrane type-1 domain-containing protein n=1 Tax=Xylanimonas ulmi TaxID=228973 RepID=A0A4Q7LZA7_9MICO|nr:hypothetical protein [Xylanibacterium ulmi]RZS60725.1 hypothetical protein EV386_1002 [Xylanibacterium ulmi]